MAATDYLDDPYAGAAASGAARAYGDLGYAAPRSGLGDESGFQSPLEATGRAARAPAGRPSAKFNRPIDPLDDPDYKRAALARKELYDNERYAEQALSHFTMSNRDALAALANQQRSLGKGAAALRAGGAAGDTGDLSASSKTLLDPKAPWKDNLGSSAINPILPKNARAILQTRQRFIDEFKRTTDARQKFDDTTFVPLRTRLMSGAGRQQDDSQPPAPDALAQRDGFWSTRPTGGLRVAPATVEPAPGSVGAGNFTQPAATEPTNGRSAFDFTPQNNPPGDEARGEVESGAPAAGLPATPDSGAKGGLRQVFGPAPDALDDGALADRRQAMATDLKAKWGGGSVADRVKMIFGRDGYGSTEDSAKPLPTAPSDRTEITAHDPSVWRDTVRPALTPFIGRQLKDERLSPLENEGLVGSMFRPSAPWQLPQAGPQETTGGKVAAGIYNPVAGLVNGMIASPGGLLTAGVGGILPAAAQKLVAGGFAADMGRNALENAVPTYKKIIDPNVPLQEKIEAGVGEAASALGAKYAASHAIGEPAARVDTKFVPQGPGLTPSRFKEDPAYYDASKAAGADPQVGRDLTNGVDPTLDDKARADQAQRALDEFVSGGGGRETPVRTSDSIDGGAIDDEWRRFSPESGTLGVPREEMPQVHAEDRGALTQFLKARGITHSQESVLPSELKPTQGEFSRDKAEKAREFSGEDRAILVSSDNHVVDGHHQWVAKLADAPDKPMRIIRLNAPIDEVLPQVKEFPSAETSGGAKPISSEQQPSATESNERESRPEEPVNPRGIDPAVGVVDRRGVQSPEPELRPDVVGAGEQPRGSEVERPSPGQGGDAAPDADERHAGDAGQPVLQPAAAQQRGDAAGSSATPGRGAEVDRGGGGQPQQGGAGEGGGRDAGAVEAKGILVGSDLDAWAQRFLKERGGQQNALFDPQQLAAIAIRSGAIFEKGIRDKAAWSAEVIRQFGEKVRDHLEPIWDQMHAFLKDPSVARKLIDRGGEKWQAGVTTFTNPEAYSKSDQEATRADLEKGLRSTPGVIEAGVTHSEGLFGGQAEPTLNTQWTAHPGADMGPVVRRITDIGRSKTQTDTFVSREVPADHPNARPAVDIKFKKPATEDEAKSVTEAFRAKGVDGFTVDREPNGDVVGLRTQYVPEIHARFDDTFDPSKVGDYAKDWRDNAHAAVDSLDRSNIDSHELHVDTHVFGKEEYGDTKPESHLSASLGQELGRRMAALGRGKAVEVLPEGASETGGPREGAAGEAGERGALGGRSPPSPGAPEASGGPGGPARPVPPEATQVGGGGSEPIGIKNASVDEQRAQLGLPPSEERHGTTDADAHTAALARIAADKEAGTKLVDKLHANPRAPDATENLILDHELVARRKAVDAAEARWNAAAATGDHDAMEGAASDAKEAQAAYTKAMDVADTVGTKSSDSLRLRKAMLKEDFSLAELTRKQERINRGKPVTDEQKATIKKEHEDFESTKADYEKKLAESEQKRAEAEADLAYNKIASKLAWEKKGTPPERASVLRTYAERAIKNGDDALARIQARIRSGKTRSSIVPLDPEELGDYAAVAGKYLAKGVLKFSEISDHMIKQFGEWIRPHLDQIFKASIDERAKLLKGLSSGRDVTAERKSTVDTMKERVAGGDAIGDLGHYVNKIAEQHLRDGVKGREPLLDAVHKTLKEVKPDITRRETMDALSGYGQLKPLNPDPIKAELRDIKGQSQQIAKLQDMQAGQGPLKTGVERRIPSDEERRLIKQVEEAKKKGGYDVTDPAKQLKTSLDATKTRLANQIKDLDFQISTGKKIVRDKAQAPTDAEADALRAKRDALKKEYDEMFKKPGLTDDQRIRLATASVTRAIADYENRIKTGAYQKRTQGSAGPTNSALDALRARRDALREQLEDLRNQANPAKTPEERALQARKTYLANRTAKLMEQLAKDDFSKPPPRPRLTDRALENAQAAHESVKQRVRQRQHEQEQANRTPAEKTIDAIPKIARFGVLSYPSVVAKLAAAAAARVAHSVVREGVISGLRQIPGVKGIAAKAPRFGSGLQLEAEVKTHTDGMMRAIRASGEYLRNREPQERVLYGKAKPDREWSNYLGRIHGALKTPASMSEFERSYYKRSLFDARRGLDPNDPTIKMQNSVAALKDADRSLFLQDNKLVDAYRSAVATFRRPNKGEAAPTLTNRSIAAGIETAVPIVKVPTNIVGEVLEHIAGPYTGAARAILAHREGLDKLSPDAADAIMRQLATGVMGNALLAAGWYLYKNIGPFHQQREKPRTDIPKEGTAVVGGTEVPKVALHNPAFTTMQVAATAHHLMDGLAGKKGADPSTEWSVVKALFGLADATPFGRETLDASKMIEDPAGTIPRTIGSRVVPGLLQQTAQFMDKDASGQPIARKPDGIWQNIELGIPGLRQSVPTAPPPKVPQGRRQGLRDYLSEPRRR